MIKRSRIYMNKGKTIISVLVDVCIATATRTTCIFAFLITVNIDIYYN